MVVNQQHQEIDVPTVMSDLIYAITYCIGVFLSDLLQKVGNDDSVCKTARDTDVKNRLLDSVGEDKGGMI